MIGLTDHELALAADCGKRAGYIQGLRGEEVFFATHLNVPVPNVRKQEYMILLGDDAGMIAEVDRIAAELGEPAGWTSDGRYETRRDFGNGVIYEAVAFPHAMPAQAEGPVAA